MALAGHRGVPRRQLHCHRGISILLVILAMVCPQAESKEEEEVQITYLWPILLTSIPLSGKEGLLPASFGTELAQLGLARYSVYVNSTLPKELELDHAYAAEFERTDHSRVNLAFQRWQKLVFADAKQVPTHQLSSQNEPLAKLPGIGYTWPELYEHQSYGNLQKNIEKLGRRYLLRAGYDELPSTLRIFIWVEVFGKGDAMRPFPRTDGAYCAGKYFASGENGGVKFAFEDPRGINPPFGKTFNHEVFPGNIIFFPVWASYFITPNMKKTPVVSYSFLIYPPEGNTRDWRQDKTASYVSNPKPKEK